MKKNQFKLLVIFLLVAILVSFSSILISNKISNSKITKIDKILSNEDYNYLPKQAKNYIKQVYKESGQILLTEKNKEENKPYLNPNFVDYLSMEAKEKTNVSVIPMDTVIDYESKTNVNDVSLPSSYDLRNVDGKNYITPVRDQGNLGICWTFATAGAAESYLLKKDDVSYNSNSTLISERQIDYATAKNGIKDYRSEYISFINRNLGEGGNFYISTIAMANGVSLNNYNSFKEFDDTDLSKMELKDVLSYNKSLYEVNSTLNMPILNIRKSTDNLTEEQLEVREGYINEVKQNIINYGASYVATYVDSKCTYDDKATGDKIIDVYNCPYNGSHAMEIIGWDDNFEYSYCADTTTHNPNISNCKNIVNGTGAWILKNSWGESTKYPYLTYDSQRTQISFIVDMKDSKEKVWDNNYILGSEVENMLNKEYLLSETKLKKEEKLKKVKFITNSIGGTYEVKILKVDGTYKTYKKETILPGLVTIDIEEDVIIDNTSKITITGSGEYIDKISFFTSNIDNEPYISLEKYDSTTISDKQMRLYSETKNIPSGEEIIYKLYEENNNDVSTNISYTNNIVVENNINTLLEFLESLKSGTYILDVIYNDKIIASININYAKMQGSGTKDEPYVITNPIQLDQIRNDLDAYYELGNDIDLTNATREGGRFCLEATNGLGCHGWDPIDNFTGSLDGKGFSIKGLYQNTYLKAGNKYSRRNDDLSGLFGNLKENVNIKNLVLENFDITCHEFCGTLAAKYKTDIENMSNSYDINMSNIIIKNGKLNAVNYQNGPYTGGLIGTLDGTNSSNINISNIYIDSSISSSSSSEFSGLIYRLYGGRVNINNIQLLENISGRNYENNSGYSAGLVSDFFGAEVNISNVISTINDDSVSTLLIKRMNTIYDDIIPNKSVIVNNINVLKIKDRDYFKRNDASDVTTMNNINSYEVGVDSRELRNVDNYKEWAGFNDNWVIKKVNGISRIPVLKFVDFEYTSIDDISLELALDRDVSIYDYIYPKTEAVKRIVYKVKDESIITIDENGIINPLKPGTTTIHVESLYDGYERDVPVTITHPNPYYIIEFDGNSGEGTMRKLVADIGSISKLPTNTFAKKYYDFIEWNTKADGTGISYKDGENINLDVEPGTTITLYAKWRGVKSTITFDPDGGTVSPASKEVFYKEEIGELPIPTREGYGFYGWVRDRSLIIDSTNEAWPTDIIVKAGWHENSFTTVFNANGGIGYTYSMDIKNGIDEKLLSNNFTREGYVFNGWNTKADGTGTSYTNEETINLTNVENSLLNLYAQWMPIKYKVLFNSNNGKDETKEQILSYDEDKALLKNTFKYTGYKFKEWNTTADGTGTSYNDETVVKNLSKVEDAIIKLYAIWIEEPDFEVSDYVKVNNYLSNIHGNTSLKNYKNQFTLKGGLVLNVYRNDNLLDDDKTLIVTGDVLKLTKDDKVYYEYINIVKGDINSDGVVDISDLAKMYNYYRKNATLTDIYLKAADVNDDGAVDISDLAKYYNYYRKNIDEI